MSMNVPSKPRLSFWQMWNMSFGFLGIQFGFALQNANTSRIFLTLGAKDESLAKFWLAAPITGLLIQPIIGFYSDRTWHPKFGRRRPYFTAGAVLATTALFLMPNSGVLGMAVVFLWIMDAAINISMEPFRALVGDMLPPLQRTTGFALQSLFIGTGAVVASFLPSILTGWFNISNVGAADTVPDSVRYSYYVGGCMLFLCVMWTVISTKEYPPTSEETVDLPRARRKVDNENLSQSRLQRIGVPMIIGGLLFSLFVFLTGIEKELYVLGFGLATFGLVFVTASACIRLGKSYLDFVHIAKDLISMPKTMVQLAYVQFFSWFALFSMWVFMTSAVTSHIFKSSDPTSAAFNEGASLAGSLGGGYNGMAAVSALFLPVLARQLGRRLTHLIALTCGGLGLISVYFVPSPEWLWLSMAGVGIAWASILSIPYAMLSGSLPPEKMGYYMGIFNFFIVIPQIIAGTVLGYLYNHLFDHHAIYVIVTGGVSLIISGLLTLRVRDNEELIVRQSAVPAGTT